MARRTTPRRLPLWTGELIVHEHVLSNGLKVLVLPRPGALVVHCEFFHPVGSVDEPVGRSGLAHFLEHMLFKGTPRFPKGEIDRLSYLAAGQANAETGEDWTHYWFTFPRERWDLALEVEADRLTHTLFPPDEVEAERQVIVEERSRDLDTPLGRLEQTHRSQSYLLHPYRNPILGWPEDLDRVSVADLERFYRTYYRPDGAVLVVAGDVDPAAVLQRATYYFEGLPRGTSPRPAPPSAEPQQRERRFFTLSEGDAVMRGLMGWPTVPLSDPDEAALGVLADVLSCGRRSRLWDRLVERDRVATWVDAAQESSRLAGQFLISLELTRACDPAFIEQVIAEEFERIVRDGPSPAELQRSRNRLEATRRWEQEDLAGLASGLGQAALWGEWTDWEEEHRQALAVMAEDLQRVAARYFQEASLTVGWSLPRPRRDSSLPKAALALAAAAAVPSERRPQAPQRPLDPVVLDSYRPRRRQLDGGLDVLTEPCAGSGTVALELYIDAGPGHEAQPGAAFLTARLCEEGTTAYDAEQLATLLEDVGAVLDVHPTGFSLRLRSEDLPLGLEILAELAIRPRFSADAFDWARERTLAELQADRAEPAYMADQCFRQAVYGDHFLSRDPRGTISSLRALNRAHVRAHHKSCYHAGSAILVVVGDYKPRTLNRGLNAHFTAWKSRRTMPRPLATPTAAARGRIRTIQGPGEQVQIALGHLGIARLDPDHDALLVLDHILGSGPGFADRLSRVLRDQMGLAYAVHGAITDTADRVPGLLRIAFGTSPEHASLAEQTAIQQLQAVASGAFDDDEVHQAKAYLAGAWVYDFQSVALRAERLLELARLGLPLDLPRRWPARLARISPVDVRMAAARHVHPDRLFRIRYGRVAGLTGRRRAARLS